MENLDIWNSPILELIKQEVSLYLHVAFTLILPRCHCLTSFLQLLANQVVMLHAPLARSCMYTSIRRGAHVMNDVIWLGEGPTIYPFQPR